MKNTKKQRMIEVIIRQFPIEGELEKQLSRLSETALAELSCVLGRATTDGNDLRWYKACGFLTK